MAVTIAGCGINPAVVKSNPPHFYFPLNGSLGRYSSFVLVPVTALFLSSQLPLYSHKLHLPDLPNPANKRRTTIRLHFFLSSSTYD